MLACLNAPYGAQYFLTRASTIACTVREGRNAPYGAPCFLTDWTKAAWGTVGGMS